MKVSSEFLSQVASYLDEKTSLKDFRRWHLSQLLNSDSLVTDDQDFLLSIESRFSDMIAGTSESSFKESLRYLLPQGVNPAPVVYAPGFFVVHTSSLLVNVTKGNFAESEGQHPTSGGLNFQEGLLIPCH